MRYFKTEENGKIKRIDASDIAVSGMEITKEEYDRIKAEFERIKVFRRSGVKINE